MSSDDRLFAAHYLPVMRLCLSRLHDAADAEDAVQEVFGRALQHASALGDDPLPWLITVAKNVCNDELRRRRRALQQQVAAAPQAAAAVPPPDVTVVGRMAAVELLGRLTPGERRAVAARLDGASVATSTTRVLLARARQKLREYLDESQSAFGTATVYSSEALHRLRSRFFGRALVDSGRAAVVIPAVLAIGVATNPASLPGSADLAPAIALAPMDGIPALRDGMDARHLHIGNNSGLGVLLGNLGARVPGANSGGNALRLTPRQGPTFYANPTESDYRLVQVYDVFPSPHYASDHTAMMIGPAFGCGVQLCSEIWRTDDGGATWSNASRAVETPAPARYLYLPTAYASGHFYAFDGGDAYQTWNGGTVFTPAVPGIGGRPVAAPLSWDLDVVVSGQTGLWGIRHDGMPVQLSPYTDNEKTAGTAAVVPASHGYTVLQPVTPAKTADLSTPLVLDRCSPICVRGATLDLENPNVSMMVSPYVATDHTVYASSGAQVAVSHDDGESFTIAQTRFVSLALIVTTGPTGRRLVSSGADNVMRFSDDDGVTWSVATVPPAPLRTGLAIAQLRPGRLITSMQRIDDTGWNDFLCSADGSVWGNCTPDT